VRGDVAEIGNAASIARNAIAIVADGEIVFAVLPTTRDRDLPRVRLDAVLDELGNSFQRVLCDRAMIRIAFQSSPIRSLPFASAAGAMSQSDYVVVCVKFSKERFGKSWKKDSASSKASDSLRKKHSATKIVMGEIITFL
jgi:hypothetical protein